MRVAFVSQRYGLEVNGGAELLCRQVAERMSRHWEVEVLSTCAVDYVTWRDEYAPGEGQVNGVAVRRFRVDFPRCRTVFDRLCRAVYAGAPCLEQQRRWIIEQGPWSSDLLRYLGEASERYDLFVFVTYNYAPALFGLPRVRRPTVLVPNAHDEPPLALEIYRPLFERAGALLFNTPEEQQLVTRRFGLTRPSRVVGLGVETGATGDAARFLERERDRIRTPFLLYLGRIEEAKGCAALFGYFTRLRAEQPERRLQLVLAGKPVMALPDHPDIVHLGFVDEQTKLDALAAAEVVVLPSPYESLSIVALEAWTQGKPVLANGECAVLAGQCRRSGGGLCYTDYRSFARQLCALAGDPAQRDALGASGRAFVERTCSWAAVEQAYLDCAAQLLAEQPQH